MLLLASYVLGGDLEYFFEQYSLSKELDASDLDEYLSPLQSLDLNTNDPHPQRHQQLLSLAPEPLLLSLLSSELLFFLHLSQSRSKLQRKCELLNQPPGPVLAALFEGMSEMAGNEEVLVHALIGETLKTGRSGCVLSSAEYRRFCYVLNRCSGFRDQTVNKVEFVNYFLPLALQEEMGMLRVRDKIQGIDEKKVSRQTVEMFAGLKAREGAEVFSGNFSCSPVVASGLRRKKEEARSGGSGPIGRMIVGSQAGMKESAVDSYLPTAYPAKLVLKPDVLTQEQGNVFKEESDSERRVLRQPAEMEGKFQGREGLTQRCRARSGRSREKRASSRTTSASSAASRASPACTRTWRS